MTMILLCLFVYFWTEVLSGNSKTSPLTVTDVKFCFEDLNIFLLWKPGNGNNLTKYYVQYGIYGDKMEAKTDCWGIYSTLCDFTNNVTAYRDQYVAQVMAESQQSYSTWTMTERLFTPFEELPIETPAFTATLDSENILVNVKLTNENQNVSIMKEIVSDYEIYVKKDKKEDVTYRIGHDLKLARLHPGIKYCISAATRYCMGRKCRKSSPSKEQCLEIIKGPNFTMIVSLTAGLLGVLLFFLLSAFFYVIYKYTFRPKARLPASLITMPNQGEKKSDIFLSSKHQNNDIEDTSKENKKMMARKNKYIRCPVGKMLEADQETSPTIILNELYGVTQCAVLGPSMLAATINKANSKLQTQYDGSIQNEYHREYGNVLQSTPQYKPSACHVCKNTELARKLSLYGNVFNEQKPADYLNKPSEEKCFINAVNGKSKTKYTYENIGHLESKLDVDSLENVTTHPVYNNVA
ncbi:interleukin-20 receptor subunit alpha-like [Erpetoichthys calabaricus]|uniref:interleukin-20 receptor subunit alpha-like n=1 Tax=Erpetoichthys calabaricus TaxID=27687 RepID=UPI0010A046A8|nr:interleukin-20 receptor subunit alpha-like [Erpetoichthys calabaricus]